MNDEANEHVNEWIFYWWIDVHLQKSYGREDSMLVIDTKCIDEQALTITRMVICNAFSRFCCETIIKKNFPNLAHLRWDEIIWHETLSHTTNHNNTNPSQFHISIRNRLVINWINNLNFQKILHSKKKKKIQQFLWNKTKG